MQHEMQHEIGIKKAGPVQEAIIPAPERKEVSMKSSFTAYTTILSESAT